MPKDHARIPRFDVSTPPGARLSPETLEAFRPSLPDSRPFLAQQARVRLMAARNELAARREALRQELAAAEREIAGLEERLHEAEAEAERFGAPRQRHAPVTSPEPAPVDHPAPAEENQDGGQAELVRLFFQEVYGGLPGKKLGYRAVHARMKVWVAEKNGSDTGSRRVASETTIRNVRNARAMRAQP